MRPPLLSLICFAVTVSSCKKYGLTSKTDLLTDGKWKVTAHTQICYCGSGFGTSSRDLYASYPTCKRDDYYLFNKSGAVEVNEGAVKCYPNNAQSYMDSWSFQNDKSSILFNNTVWNIVLLNKTTFVITTVVLLGTGETITFSKL